MKDKRIVRMKIAAERNHAISDSFQLLCRIGSFLYVDPKRDVDAAFPLPWSTVAMWCGVDDKKTAYRRIAKLVDHGFLKCDGLRGCPPINYYFLQLNCPEKGAIDCPTKGAINSPKNGANVTPEKGAINVVKKGAHHISNSFQEEKIKGKRKEMNSSLPLTETSGDDKSSLSLTGTKGIEQMDDAKRESHVHALRRLRLELESDGKPKPKAKALLRKK